MFIAATLPWLLNAAVVKVRACGNEQGLQNLVTCAKPIATHAGALDKNKRGVSSVA